MSSELLEAEVEPAIHEASLDPISKHDSNPSQVSNKIALPQARFQWMTYGLGALLMVVAFGSGWWLSANRSQEHHRITLPNLEQKYSSDALIVTSSPITIRSVSRYVEAVGTLNGFEEIVLSSKQEGRVLKIHHDLSSVVEPNELLLELDPIDASLAYQQAEKNVQTELAKWGFTKVPSETEDLRKLPTVVSARLKFELAQTKLDRLIPLKSTNSVSAEDLDQARSDALVAESEWQNQLLMANSAAATARLRQAELAIAEQRVRDLAIRAPIPTLVASPSDQYYRISERLVSEGSLVRPGTEVFKLVLGQTLKLKLSVPESFSSAIEVGQSVEVSTGGLDQICQGKVARISPAIDRATRTFLVEVDVPNQDGKLKPGGFAKAKILTGTNEHAVTIPIAGLYSFAGINKIFLDDHGVAREKKVVIGEQTPTWVEITTPSLPADAMVVTSGQRLLSEGSAITIRQVNDAKENPVEAQSAREQAASEKLPADQTATPASVIKE